MHCVRYHEALYPGRRIGRCIFVGGESRQHDLCMELARGLRLTAKAADPLSRISASAGNTTNIDLSQPQPGWGVAVGLCLSPTDL